MIIPPSRLYFPRKGRDSCLIIQFAGEEGRGPALPGQEREGGQGEARGAGEGGPRGLQDQGIRDV